MLKGKSLQKYLIRAKWILCFLVIAYLSVILLLNLYLPKIQKEIISSLNRKLHSVISIGHVFFVFPNRLYFYDISIKGRPTRDKSAVLDIRKLRMKLSFSDLLFDQRFLVSQIKIERSYFLYRDLQKFLTQNTDLIKNIIENMPQGNAQIYFQDVWVSFLDNKKMRLNSIFKCENNSWMGQGQVQKITYLKQRSQKRQEKNVYRKQDYQFRINGLISENQVFIDSLNIYNLYFQAKLWGDMDMHALRLKGYVLADSYARKNRTTPSGTNRFLQALKRFGQNNGYHFMESDLTNPDIHVLDIDALINFELPVIRFSRVNFTLNNIPVHVRGKLNIADHPSAHLFCHIYPSRNMVFFKKAELEWKWKILKNTNSVDGRMTIEFKEGATDYSLKQIKAAFTNAIFDWDKIIPLDMYVGTFSVACKTGVDEHELSLRDLRTRINDLHAHLKIIDIISPLDAGTLKGRIWIQTDTWPVKVYSHMYLNNVETQRLESLYPHFSQIQGKMSGKMIFSAQETLKLKGDLKMAEGQLVNFEFFKWLADSFDMPSLATIDFNSARMGFTIQPEGVQLQDIHIESPDASMSGYYHVNSHNLVNSQLTLSLNKEVLRESRKFRPVIKLFRSKSSLIPFEFQLSGHSETMNFYWMDSPVKKRIQEKIPHFIERKIERGIDKMVTEPVSAASDE